MGFNEFIGKLFGNKATRDMKEIKPWVDKIKAVYPEIAKLSNDELRAKTVELKKYISDSAAEEQKKIEELKGTIETTELEDREGIFAQIDKLEKEVLEKYEKALDDVLPQAFAIVKDTARRFSENPELVVTATDFDRELAAQGKDFVRIEDDKAIWQNHWIAGGNDMVWSMVHYDVQLFGGVVLHKGKIAEMATGEGKTLVATLPVFLNALTGNGVHVVTVNDYLSKRDSEWMGPLYQFQGIGCLIYSWKKFEILHPDAEERRWNSSYMKTLCGMGVPMGLQYSITAIGSVILQSAVNTLGSNAVASMTAGSKIGMFFCCPFDAMGSTMATYGGQNVGAKKMDRISKGLKACSMLGIGYAILAFVILALTGRNLALFFVERAEVEVIGNVYLFLLINSAFYIPLAFVNIVRFLIQGMGYSKFAILAGVCEMAARTLVGFALVPLFGFPAACFASPVAWIFADAFLFPAYRHVYRKTEKMLNVSIQ